MSLFVVIWCFPSSQFYEGIKNIIKERYLAGVEQLRLTLEVLKKCFFFRFTHLLMTNSRKSSQKNACVSGDSDVLLRLVHTTVCEVRNNRENCFNNPTPFWNCSIPPGHCAFSYISQENGFSMSASSSCTLILRLHISGERHCKPCITRLSMQASVYVFKMCI
jgi:hypothetical protein